MKATIAFFVLCIGLWGLSSCASRKPYYAPDSAYLTGHLPSPAPSEIKYTLFLSGGLNLGQETPVLQSILRETLDQDAGLVLLGDVLSIDDLPESMTDDFSAGSASIQTIIELDKRYKNLFLVPGQKEWTTDKKISSTAIRSLDGQLKGVKHKGRLIEPSKGCGTPEVVRLTKHSILVLVDSQWAIEMEARQDEKRPGCDLANILEWRQALKDIIKSHPADHIIIATHHPVYANGPTAGNYPLSSHLLPLPVVGTVITALKSWMGSSQHFGHPAYEAYRAAIISAVDGCPSCIIVSGHEESLQYYHREGQHYMVAGSGSAVRHARKGERSGFSYMSLGYVRMDELTNGQLRISFEAVHEGRKTERIWETELSPPRREEPLKSDITHAPVPSLGDSIVASASLRYGQKKFLRGEFYRKAWSAPVSMPVLWLDSVHGGLVPVQLGGGNQTRSLRMENAAGEQFVIRSIDKKVTSVLPPALRGTFAENIVQDGIAASHPYGALVIPKLAHAAGIFYATPRLVYVPHQAALGIYNQDVGDGIYLFEERPGGNTQNVSSFGNTPKTISTADLVELLEESPEHIVDQKAVLRARLFDVWVGDWDRHDDQWRWATFSENGHTVYRPIPRDRDQVFFKNDGVLDYIASRPYFNPPLRKFDEEIDYLPGLIWAGKHFDRSFLHELTHDDFVAEAKLLQERLTDEVIEEAFKDWPKTIDELDGEDIRRFLRARRDDLMDYASQFYHHISREVYIPASADRDIITLRAIDDDHLMVRVDRMYKNGRYSTSYQRVFEEDVTREIRLFSLGKRDTIRLEGEGRSSILIRIIGGGGEDVLINSSTHLQVIAYDMPDGLVVKGRPVSRQFNSRPYNNSYDRTDWKINRSIHFPSPAYFTDEGLGLTYNYWLTRFRFRSDPYKSRHAAALSYYFNTGSFIGKYSGEWLHTFGDVDFGLDAYVTGPTFTQFFYGLGNSYIDFGENRKYHIVKGSQIVLTPSFSHRFGFGSKVSLSPAYQYIDIEDSHKDPRFIYTPASHLTPGDFGQSHYASLSAMYHFERLDNPGFPSRGGEFGLSAGVRTSMGSDDYRHALLSGSGSLYIPFDVNGTIVLATHFGADKIIGEYAFFHALTLGGLDKVRGFRRDRFAGDARFYHANDLRVKLFKSRGVIPFSLGVYGSVDYGRVWYEDDSADADQWHTAFGGGIFLVPLGLTAFRIGYMIGEDDKQLNIGGALRF